MTELSTHIIIVQTKDCYSGLRQVFDPIRKCRMIGFLFGNRVRNQDGINGFPSIFRYIYFLTIDNILIFGIPSLPLLI
jgi:hypothetical protein